MVTIWGGGAEGAPDDVLFGNNPTDDGTFGVVYDGGLAGVADAFEDGTRVMKTGSGCPYNWFHFCSVSHLGAHRI